MAVTLATTVLLVLAAVVAVALSYALAEIRFGRSARRRGTFMGEGWSALARLGFELEDRRQRRD